MERRPRSGGRSALAGAGALLVFVALGASAGTLGAEQPTFLAAPPGCTGLSGDVTEDQARLASLYETNLDRYHREFTELAVRDNNVGGARVAFPSGSKDVYRSSILPRSPACLDALVQRGVRTIVNLYTGDAVDESALMSEEETAFRQLGGLFYVHVLSFSDRPKSAAEMAEVHRRIGEIVRLIRSSDGAVLVHCVRGMHRTGVVFGSLLKCIDHAPMDVVLDDYERHVGWRDAAHPGGHRDSDVEILRTLDCSALDRAASPPSTPAVPLPEPRSSP
jgi:protein-tyrosine phosphatase family protein